MTTDLAAALAALSPSETTRVWLEVARTQASRREPGDLMRQRDRDAYVEPSPLDLRTVHILDGLALDAAQAFEAVLLSPVAPLGACSVVAPTSQNRTVPAARATEVVSDPTNVLAIECARRLRTEPTRAVRLCTSHQVLRAQPFPPGQHFTRHFRMFAMAEAGRARADDGFEVDAIARQLGVFDAWFDACAALGCAFPDRKAIVHTKPGHDALTARVREAVAARLPHVAIESVPFDAAYYDGVRVMFGARSIDGAYVPIADVGRFDWVGRLAANRKLRFVASGLGTQLAPALFQQSPP